jgi:hypothetical protein
MGKVCVGMNRFTYESGENEKNISFFFFDKRNSLSTFYPNCFQRPCSNPAKPRFITCAFAIEVYQIK